MGSAGKIASLEIWYSVLAMIFSCGINNIKNIVWSAFVCIDNIGISRILASIDIFSPWKIE